MIARFWTQTVDARSRAHVDPESLTTRHDCALRHAVSQSLILQEEIELIKMTHGTNQQPSAVTPARGAGLDMFLDDVDGDVAVVAPSRQRRRSSIAHAVSPPSRNFQDSSPRQSSPRIIRQKEREMDAQDAATARGGIRTQTRCYRALVRPAMHVDRFSTGACFFE